MARSSTTVVKGQQLALKHGAYTASAKLARQSKVLEELGDQLKAKKIDPLAKLAYRTLQQTIKRQRKVTAWLNKHDAFDNEGRVLETAAYEERLLKSVHAQTMAIWRMIHATDYQAVETGVSEAQARAQRYSPGDGGNVTPIEGASPPADPAARSALDTAQAHLSTAWASVADYVSSDATRPTG